MTALLTDSTWSMPPGLAEERGIIVLPLQVTAGARSVEDTAANAEEIDGVLKGGRNLGTSQPTRLAIEEGFARATASGERSALGIFISEKLSGTCESVRAAAESQEDFAVEVIDSATVAGGTGLAVLAASDALQAGASAEEAADRARAAAASARVCFTVSDLMHLHRGGRLPAGKAIVGRALGVQPILQMTDGELTLAESVRGAAKASARMRARTLGELGPARVVVLHSGDLAAAERLGAAIAADRPEDEILFSPISRTLRVHTGPGALGIAAAPLAAL